MCICIDYKPTISLFIPIKWFTHTVDAFQKPQTINHIILQVFKLYVFIILSYFRKLGQADQLHPAELYRNFGASLRNICK